jgi:DNA-directed RNA polymerase specialized sigma24 family protein
MSAYVTKEELSNAIIDYRATGKISPALATILQNIATGVASKYSSEEHREEAVQNTWILFLRHIHKVKLEGSPFNYLSTIAHNACRHLHRCNANNLRLMYEYYEKSRFNT